MTRRWRGDGAAMAQRWRGEMAHRWRGDGGGGADGSEAHDGGGGSAGDRGRCMYDGTYVRRHTGQE